MCGSLAIEVLLGKNTVRRAQMQSLDLKNRLSILSIESTRVPESTFNSDEPVFVPGTAMASSELSSVVSDLQSSAFILEEFDVKKEPSWRWNPVAGFRKWLREAKAADSLPEPITLPKSYTIKSAFVPARKAMVETQSADVLPFTVTLSVEH